MLGFVDLALAVPELGIDAAAADQGFVVAAFNDHAVIQHDDLVGIDDGREAMRDHQRGAAARHLFERILNVLFGETVECRGGLVQHQNRRGFQQGAGNRHALLFAARQFQPALAHARLVTFGQRGDEMVDLGQTGGLLDLGLCRIPAAIADVVADRIIEQHRILRHHADGGAQRHLRDVGDVLSVDGDLTRLRLVKPVEQPREGRFARSRRPHHRNRLSGRDFKTDAAQDRTFGHIAEHDIVEPDRAGADLQGLGRGIIGHFGGAVEHIEHHFDIGHRLFDFAVNHAHEIERLIELQQHGIDEDKIPQRIAAFDNAIHHQSHADCEAEGENGGLSGIQHRQRIIGLHRG